MGYYTGKVIWITGASSGIGEALAYQWAAAGAKLILSSRREAELERVRQATTSPGNVKILPLDLEDINALPAKTTAAIALFGQVDIMVHNGGISSRSTVAETEMEVHRRVMELDYFSYVALTKALLPHFQQRRNGHFVVMSSVMGKIGTPLRAAYAGAKHALHGFFDCLRAEVHQDNIKVTVLTPGYIQTNITVHAVTKDGSPLGVTSDNIKNGLSAHKAAQQISRLVAAGKFEAYVGKKSSEWAALLLNRLAPAALMKKVRNIPPK
ncbi:SDR family oxidoreductase [Chitinophaga pendula]|uniref:SDR family oxidoreductase n=1 Tax=Chitinophaga TaxID=79328 RepID=UPI000BAF5D15|nr:MULTISPECIES: SDR family oxidoreductase [Chitinophaga]ASZ12682.1 short chain dehydrogenase [Chitinophaga sp. MD30]UCJ09707.1 SDR family oxidoreductase [Chitinophaga pendula]